MSETRITVIHNGGGYNEMRLLEAFTHWYNGGCCDGKVRELFEQVVKERATTHKTPAPEAK